VVVGFGHVRATVDAFGGVEAVPFGTRRDGGSIGGGDGRPCVLTRCSGWWWWW
jgi:hypothetical protein